MAKGHKGFKVKGTSMKEHKGKHKGKKSRKHSGKKR